MKKSPSNFLESLDSFLNSYLIKERGLSFNTQRSYKYTFKLLIEYFFTDLDKPADQILFSDLNYEVITNFLDWLEKQRGCSAITQNQRMAALKSFSAYAQIYDADAATVFRTSMNKIQTKKYIPHKISFFSRDEVRFLLEVTEDSVIGHRNRAIFAFMYATGARAQEVCDLKIADIHYTENRSTVIISGKGNKMRRISISDKPSKIINDYLHETEKIFIPKAYVFSSRINEQMKISCIEEIYRKYIRMAKEVHPGYFPYSYSPHSMRHTTATHMLESGVSLMVIKNFLGHSSVETTQMYAEVTEKHFDAETAKWNEKWLQTKYVDKQNQNCPAFLR